MGRGTPVWYQKWAKWLLPTKAEMTDFHLGAKGQCLLGKRIFIDPVAEETQLSEIDQSQLSDQAQA
eukprot:gene4353-18967_t